MTELFKSLFARPRLAVLLLTSSLIITVLSLVPAFYVIIVLNKYMASGVLATLVGLTVGTVLSVCFEFAMRQNRSQVCGLWLTESTLKLFSELSAAMKGQQLPSDQFQKLASGAKLVDSVNKNNIVTYILDWPFQLMLLVVLFMISWTAGLISVLFALILYVLDRYNTVTQFRDSTTQNLEMAILSMITVAVISTGSFMVMQGKLDIGALIGSNILAARFVQSAQKFYKASKLTKARHEAIERLGEFVHSGTKA